MKKIKNKIISGVLSVVVSIACILPVSAATIQEKKWETPTEFNGAEKYGNIEERETITINGELQPLFVTYDNREDALEKFKNTTKNSCWIDFIREKYTVQDLYETNIEEYQTVIQKELFDTEDSNTQQYLDVTREAGAFLSIYIDDDLNSIIKSAYNNYQKNPNEENLQALDVTLPIYAPLVDKLATNIDKVTNNNSRRVGGFNVSAGNQYAIKYASNPNTAYKYLGDTDCTNFVSQILHAGNVPKSGNWSGGKFQIKTDWGHANSFANRFGRTYFVKLNMATWENFTNAVNSGDVIGYSAANNGYINHVGYVVGKSGRNLRIAQHSKNYIGWTNGGAALGWMQLSGYTLFRIG